MVSLTGQLLELVFWLGCITSDQKPFSCVMIFSSRTHLFQQLKMSQFINYVGYSSRLAYLLYLEHCRNRSALINQETLQFYNKLFIFNSGSCV